MERPVPVMMNAPAMYVKVVAVVPIMVLPVIRVRIAADIKVAVVMASVRIKDVSST